MASIIIIIWMMSYLCGAILGPLFELCPSIWLVMGSVICFSSFLVFGKRYLWASLFAFGVLFLSVSNFQLQKIEYQDLNVKYADELGKYVGSVSSIPTDTESGSKAILGDVSVNGVPVKGNVVIYTRKYPEIKFADRLSFAGKLKKYNQRENSLVKDRVFGEMTVYDHEKIGKENSVGYRIKGLLFFVRIRFNEALQKALPQKEASLASGLLLGEKSLIDAEFKRALQNSGTSHIIALSGYNITIILSLFVMVQMKLSRKMNLLLPLIFIVSFVVMTGASASIVRAGIMGFMPVLARYWGRSNNSFIAIMFSAFIMVLLNPYIVLYDVGFQLSFAALCGMIYLGPLISVLLRFFPNGVRFVLAETLGAQLAALPLLLFYFGTISIISPISNIVVLSLVPFSMLAAFLVGLLGVFVPLTAQLAAIPSYVLLHYFYLIINYFGSLPFASTQLKIENPVWLIITYILILDIIFISHRYVKRVILNEKSI